VPRVAGFSAVGRHRTISSRHNPAVQLFRQLRLKRQPPDARVLIDGWHLLIEARRAGVPIECVAFTPDLLNTRETAIVADELAQAGVEVLAVAAPVMAVLSPVRTPSGVVAIARHEAIALERVVARPPQLLLIAVDVQDPGNLGAIVRCAEAAGATGLVACGASADPFAWKALRGSMGSAFRLPIARAPIDLAINASRAARVRILAAAPRVGHSLFEVDLRQPTAFLLGGEGSGLPRGMLAQADGTVSIPMQAPVESLNVAVSAALLLYEAMRQRSGLRSEV